MREYIRRRVPVTDEALERAFLFSREVRFAKGDVILRARDYCHFIGFLNSGLIMVTLYDDLGKEVICNFCFENEFFTYVESINDNIPSHKNFIAMEDCSVLLLNKSQLPEVFAIHPAFEALYNRVILEDLHRMMLYAQVKQMQTAEERYVKMMATHPELLNRVPLKFIAGFWGYPSAAKGTNEEKRGEAASTKFCAES